MNDILQDMRALPHISVSQLKCFIGCARKFKFRYIDRAEPAFRGVALALGTAWHRTIGHRLVTHAEGVTSENGELHEYLRAALDHELHNGVPVLFDDDEPEATLVDRAIRMLDVFVAEVPPPEAVLGVEVPFSVELVDHETGEVLPVPMIGALDAVVVKGGEPTVLELKTGKKRWAANELEYDLQPTAYKIAARELGFGEPRLELCLTTKAKTPTVQLEEFVRTAADERDLVATAASVLRGVDAGVDHPIRGWQCRGCPYSGVCS
jgi:CRISPR/Cas system-associated exonuclease Cas4 (RecB family)